MATRGHQYVLGAVGGIAVIASVIGGVRLFQVAETPSMSPSLRAGPASRCAATASVTTCSEPDGAPSQGAAAASGFHDGAFAAQGRYLTPGGSEAVGVRLTVADGLVVRSELTVQATSPTARQFQQQFATRYATSVVSRELGSVTVDRVAGASLTSLGFDNALDQIRAASREQD